MVSGATFLTFPNVFPEHVKTVEPRRFSFTLSAVCGLRIALLWHGSLPSAKLFYRDRTLHPRMDDTHNSRFRPFSKRIKGEGALTCRRWDWKRLISKSARVGIEPVSSRKRNTGTPVIRQTIPWREISQSEEPKQGERPIVWQRNGAVPEQAGEKTQITYRFPFAPAERALSLLSANVP